MKSNILPDGLTDKSENWIFGCDICQDVCPWNRFSQPHQHPELEPLQEILTFDFSQWNRLDSSAFNLIFKESPLKRSKWDGLKRNLKLFKGG